MLRGQDRGFGGQKAVGSFRGKKPEAPVAVGASGS